MRTRSCDGSCMPVVHSQRPVYLATCGSMKVAARLESMVRDTLLPVVL